MFVYISLLDGLRCRSKRKTKNGENSLVCSGKSHGCHFDIMKKNSIKSKKWPYSVQQNLDHMRQNGCQKRIPRVRKHRKQYKVSIGHFDFFFL